MLLPGLPISASIVIWREVSRQSSPMITYSIITDGFSLIIWLPFVFIGRESLGSMPDRARAIPVLAHIIELINYVDNINIYLVKKKTIQYFSWSLKVRCGLTITT